MAGRINDWGPKRSVLKMLVRVRLQDGWALWMLNKPERLNGSVYLAGYAVECALKARLCEDLGVERLPKKFYTHALPELAQNTRAGKKIATDPELNRLFGRLAEDWRVALRYEYRSYDRVRVRKYLERAEEFTQWLFGALT